MNTRFSSEQNKVDASAGRKHYNMHRKTSLFGSETPREEKSRNYGHRYSNSRNIFPSSDGQIVYERDMEKHENSERSGLKNNVPPVRTRLQYEYEKQMSEQKKAQTVTNGDGTYPGFGAGFGAGISAKDRYNRIKSADKAEGKGQLNSSFSALGLRNVDSNEKNPEVHYKNYEDAKAYADFLETEIRRLKIQNKDEIGKMTDYNTTKSMNNYNNNEEIDAQDEQFGQSDLQKEAEFRARQRELDRLRQANQLERERIMREQDQYNYSGQTDLIRENEQMSRERSNDHINQQRQQSSATRNDYRQYTEEELQSCKRSPINPSLYKRTSLGGYVNPESDNSHFSKPNGGQDYDYNQGMKRNSRNSSGYRTRANIFPEESQHELNSPNLQNYKMNAPFATE